MPTIIPNPPEGGPDGDAPAETFEILFQSLQAFALRHGFCVIKQRASNYRDKKPMRYDIVCDRGQGRPSASASLRETTTQKVNCPWKVVANALKDNDWEWKFRIRHGEHNHDASSDSSAHAMHRRITPAQQQSLADIRGIGASEPARQALSSGIAFLRQCSTKKTYIMLGRGFDLRPSMVIRQHKR
jgi:hypothetical protein